MSQWTVGTIWILNQKVWSMLSVWKIQVESLDQCVFFPQKVLQETPKEEPAKGESGEKVEEELGNIIAMLESPSEDAMYGHQRFKIWVPVHQQQSGSLMSHY